MEILRFGPGYRQPARLVGAVGLAEQAIWPDARARVSELAFAARAVLPLLSSPEDGLFIVVSGGGWVQVGEERAAVNHGEAVLWPAGVVHAAWTEGTPMRVILVELPGRTIGAARAAPYGAADVTPTDPAVSEARGVLARQPVRPPAHDAAEGEPW